MLPAAPGTDGRDEPSRDGDRPSATRAFSLARVVAGMFRRETPAKADSSGSVGREGPSARIRGRLFRRYIALFVAVVCAALTVNALAEAWFLYQDRKQALVRIQHEQADAAAAKISQFISDIESHIGWTTQSSWSAETIARRRIDAQRLLRQVPAIAEFAQLDPDGREQLRVSRVSLDAVGTGIDFSGESGSAKRRKRRALLCPRSRARLIPAKLSMSGKRKQLVRRGGTLSNFSVMPNQEDNVNVTIEKRLCSGNDAPALRYPVSDVVHYRRQLRPLRRREGLCRLQAIQT